MKYRDTLTEIMTELSLDRNTMFIGQQVMYKGNPMSTTLVNVPVEQKIELPIMEDSQMGISIGISMTNKRVITFYPRWDFLLIAANQLVTHADKFKDMTNMDLHLIIRVGKGSDKPLDPGPQHKNNYLDAFKLLTKNVKYYDCKSNIDLKRAYDDASKNKGVYVIAEYPELYDKKTTLNLIKNEKYIHDFLNQYHIEDYKISETKEVTDTPNENFIYVYYSRTAYLSQEILTNETLPIETHIKEILKNNKNLYLFLILSFECDFINVIQIVNNICEIERLPKNQIYVINDNDLLEDFNRLDELPNFKTFHPIPQSASNTFSLYHPNFCYEKQKRHFFSLLNKGCKTHRTSILLYMKKNNLLDLCDWSYIRTQDLVYDIKWLTNGVISSDESEQYQEELDYLKSFKSKHSLYDRPEDLVGEMAVESSFPFYHLYGENPFKYSYVNIVTEAQYERESVIHITEKSFVPFYFAQIPIFVATHNHVKILRKRYNFDFFDDLVDHSYDDELDPIIRFQKICKEISRLVENKDKIIEFYNNNHERFKNNYTIVANIKNHNDDREFILSFINK